MRTALLILLLEATSLFAFVFRPQHAEFTGNVLKIEKCHAPSWDPSRTNVWKAIVKVEKVERMNLNLFVTNLTDEVWVYYDQPALLKTNSTYLFNCFLSGGDDTNRVSLTVFGGSVTPR